MSMKATIKDGILTITINTNLNPTLSTSGKSLIVATSGGNQVTDCMVQGKPLTIGLNAYIKS
jgi:hypothetical protein